MKNNIKIHTEKNSSTKQVSKLKLPIKNAEGLACMCATQFSFMSYSMII